MLHPQNVENIDQLLNELESEAHAGVPTATFVAHLLHRVRLLLEADSAAMLLPTAGSWIAIASSGQLDPMVISSFSAQHRELEKQANESLVGTVEKSPWFAIPIRAANFSKGCLLVNFSQPLPPASLPGLLELLAAFAELLALRQMADLESFLDNRWEKLQQLCLALSHAVSRESGNALLVNQLVPLFGAARVSLASSTVFGRPKLEAVSGVPTLDQRSKSTLTLTEFAGQTFTTGRPVARQHKPASPVAHTVADAVLDDGAFANLLGLPLMSRGGEERCNFVLVVEWQSYDEMVEASITIANALPTLSLAWQQHRRWERVPSFIKKLTGRQLGFSFWRGTIVRWGLFIAIFILVYVSLMQPYPLTIEAEGVLEPAVQQTVFANLDGYAEALLIEDGQKVVAGQQLLRLSSPDLELRIEELSGELRTIREKRNALQIAGNQVESDTPDVILSQNRIAAEIKQIDTQEVNLGSQLKMLIDEREKATVVAPIDGYVVAKDLKQQISSRPLRRGDALFRVVDLEGAWHLRIQVADKDSGYVLANRDRRETQPLRFVIDSIPGEQFPAKVDWVANTVQNQYGAGCYVEMRAGVDDKIIQRTHMGASVRVYFMCGNQPVWFVWCRPLVESIQRRFWFWS